VREVGRNRCDTDFDDALGCHEVKLPGRVYRPDWLGLDWGRILHLDDQGSGSPGRSVRAREWRPRLPGPRQSCVSLPDNRRTTTSLHPSAWSGLLPGKSMLERSRSYLGSDSPYGQQHVGTIFRCGSRLLQVGTAFILSEL